MGLTILPSHPCRPAEPPERAVSALRAVLVVGIALLTAALLDSRGLVRSAQALPAGWLRTALVAVAEPIDDVAHVLRLDVPHRALSAWFGHPEHDGVPELSRLASSVSERLGPAMPAPGQPAGHHRHGVPRPGPTEFRCGAPAWLPFDVPRLPPLPCATPPPPVPTPSRARPLRLLITGDSLSDYLGQQLLQITAHDGRLTGARDVHNGTGLIRPDAFDWATYARKAVASAHPDVIVIALGANDDQGIGLPDGTALPAGSQRWAVEYRRRAMVVMSILADGGHRRVYWAGLPVARDHTRDRIYIVINEALASAASAVRGVVFVDERTASTVQGHYSDFLVADGQRVLARAEDGVHYTFPGSLVQAEVVLRALREDLPLR